MKELSIEQKAQRYDEAFRIAQELYNNPNSSSVGKGYVYTVFPELKESENERIKKALIDYFDDANKADENPLQSYGIHTDKAIAWLEKQETSYTKRDVDDAYLKGVTDTKNEIEKQYEASYQIRKDIATFIFKYKGDIKDRAKWIDYLGIKVSFVEKQGEQETLCDKCRKEHLSHSCQDITELGRCAVEHEQKSVDKVEPKFNFKVGQYIVTTGKCVYLISKIDGFNVTLVDTNGDEYVFDASSLDDAHEWTIQDAKDGDVLINKNYMGEHPFIFKEIKPSNIKTNIPNPLTVLGYCGIGGTGFTKGDWWGDTANCIYYPATKEQRDALFLKMKEAGYEWDAEKKELKKIENEIEIPFGAKDSELQEDTYYIPKGFHAEIDDDKVVLKKGEKPTAWSEEDESYLNTTIAYLKDAKEFKKTAENCINWLKSLRPQKYVGYNPYKATVESITEMCKHYDVASHSGLRDFYDNVKVKCKDAKEYDSLFPQNTWKPSEEQMEALWNVYEGGEKQSALASLYNDLKKL